MICIGPMRRELKEGNDDCRSDPVSPGRFRSPKLTESAHRDDQTFPIARAIQQLAENNCGDGEKQKGEKVPSFAHLSPEALTTFAGKYGPDSPPGICSPPIEIVADLKGLWVDLGMAGKHKFVPLSPVEFVQSDAPAAHGPRKVRPHRSRVHHGSFGSRLPNCYRTLRRCFGAEGVGAPLRGRPISPGLSTRIASSRHSRSCNFRWLLLRVIVALLVSSWNRPNLYTVFW
jgi:hypothetical protein